MNKKVMRHKAICDELNSLYERKNHDYGDSFHQTFVEEGLAMTRIRLGDKFSRFKTLSRLSANDAGQQQVTDESIRDTLMDLANYAIMTILEMDEEKGMETPDPMLPLWRLVLAQPAVIFGPVFAETNGMMGDSYAGQESRRKGVRGRTYRSGEESHGLGDPAGAGRVRPKAYRRDRRDYFMGAA